MTSNVTTEVTDPSGDSFEKFSECFQDPNVALGALAKICVTRGTLGPLTICTASFRGRTCSSCVYYPSGLCNHGIVVHVGDKADGFMMDCSNVDTGYKRITACEGTKKASVEPSYVYHGNHYSNNNHYNSNHHSSSNNNDDDVAAIIGNLIFFAFVIGYCFLRFFAGLSRRPAPGARRRRYRRQINPRTGQLEIVQLTAISEQEMMTIQHHQRPAACESIPDPDHPTFQFLDASQKSPETATRLRTNVINGNWQSIRDYFRSLREPSSRNSHQRYFWMTVVEKEIAKAWSTQVDETASMSRLLDEWLENEPDNVDCRILRLETYIAWAWNARTGALAAAVSQQRAAVFHKRLLEAANEFVQAKPYCSTDPLLYAMGMTIAKGLGRNNNGNVTMEDCEKGLREQTAEPRCYTAHTRALQYYCRKWHGSHERMFQYAYNITTGLPEGHPLWVLIPMAHYERNLIQPTPGYWRRAQVVREIYGAYRHAFPRASETAQSTEASALSQEWASRNYFLYCLILTGQLDAARKQVRVIGRRPSERPWHSLAAYKRRLMELGFDVSESFPSATDGGPRDIPVATATIVTIPVASAEVSHDEEDTDDLPVASATIV
ncbi:expressed unknown protein [Seminavis robusta]|uniref:Uncharacterized protein n=1 Tax=Seminavis robusta TaxID=568900 RepID=A0A9N8DSQ9_9STRA|nr:expressed unknown protein [Seminavis robusta]|eukprot:Sro324_g117590.1 n/a (607) ;mRNA; f:42569-44389